MLVSLSIRDIVLIDRLDLTLSPGLCALTGETGAGKSILLDALGLALGARSDRGLVRRGAERGSVSAVFALVAPEPVHALLDEHGLPTEDEVVLRRVVGADGRSRAFINDQPVGTAMLRTIADLLVEVHGQNDQHGLLDPGVQLQVLDAFGAHDEVQATVRDTYARWREAEGARTDLAAVLAQAAAEQAELRATRDELLELDPTPGEEAQLVAARTRLANREKLAGAIHEALDLVRGDAGIETRLGQAQRVIERARPGAEGLLQGVAEALDRTRVEAEEAGAALEQAAAGLDAPELDLERIEERLFALRAAARRHRLEVHELADLLARAEERLEALDAGADRMKAVDDAERAARAGFEEAARRLSSGRAAAAAALEVAVTRELAPLKLDKARFVVRLIELSPETWSAAGAERAGFEIATNPGEAPGPLARIASGGELARLMLALKVVLARTGRATCLVFDEVDTGIGGATAEAVGERLARLGDAAQVLVVTHAPQVAAKATHHYRVEKRADGERATVSVRHLADPDRQEEIARMLAGARVTDAARAAAASLMAEPA